MLAALADDIWLRAVPYRAMGVMIGRKIVVVRLARGVRVPVLTADDPAGQ